MLTQLTARDPYTGEVWIPDENKRAAAKRLAAYEDIGLTPAQIRELRGIPANMPGWICTEDRLPEIGKAVIIARVYEAGKPLKVEQAILQPRGWWKVFGTNLKKVPYWMPLPEPPEVPR